MLLKFFRGTGPGVVLLIFLTAVIVWLGAFINPHEAISLYYDTNPMPLYGLLRQVIGTNAMPGVIFSFILVLLMSFLMINFNTSHFFINERTFLPGAIYILLTGLFPYYQLLNPVLPASVFLMLAIRRIMDAYRKSGIAFNFFDSSFLIGTGFLFYANLIWFELIVIIGIAILRTGNIKELIIALLGFITPSLLTVGIYYAAGKDILSLLSVLDGNLFVGTGEYYFSRLAIIGLIILGLMVLVCLIDLISRLNSKKIKARKTFTELIWALVISFATYFILPSASVELIWLAGISISYIIAHYLIFSRKRLIPEIFFAVLFIVIVCTQIGYLV